MKLKRNFSLILLVCLSACSAYYPIKKTIADTSAEIQKGQMLPVTATAEIVGETIQLEVARTPEQQSIGLMFRESLADDRGMLFPFQEARTARFWMKNVPISLDMIFLNNGRVVDIAANVPPCTTEPCPIYGPEVPVDSVLELRGGRTGELGLELDDPVTVEFLNSLPQ